MADEKTAAPLSPQELYEQSPHDFVLALAARVDALEKPKAEKVKAPKAKAAK